MKTLFLSTPPTAAPLLSSSLSLFLSHQSVSDSTCAGVHGRAAAEILTRYPTTVRHNPAMDREELWDTDPVRGKEGAWQRQRDCKSKRIQRRKERDRFQGWRLWPFHPVEPLGSRALSRGATDFSVIRASGCRYWWWQYGCWCCVCWVLCFVR